MNGNRGYTLVELVMTLVIIGILSVVAAPRFFESSIFQTRGALDQVQAALRYGQKIAVAQNRNVSVTISAGASPSCGTMLTAGNVSCVISNSVTVSPALPKTVIFDILGRPAAAASMVIGTTAIIVEAETGYVH